MLPASREFEAALSIIHKLRAEGYQAYLAGGCVRDLVLGREPVDYDVASSATPDVVLKMFPRTFAVGAHFGVVLVASDREIDSPQDCSEGLKGEKPTEVATFRSDGAYSDGRHPDAVRYTLSAEEDVRRRDFTINGLLLDVAALPVEGREKQKQVLRLPFTSLRVAQDDRCGGGTQDERPEEGAEHENAREIPAGSSSTGTSSSAKGTGFSSYNTPAQKPGALAPEGSIRTAVLDYVGGLADLDAGLIRAIGRPDLRFEEDHLRMLRAVRFAARFGFELEAETMRAIRALAPRIHAVSRERIRDELTKMLTEGHARRAFELLDETGLLAEVLPEVARMKGVEQPPQFHPEGDVWVHSLLVLDQLPEECTAALAWGALLHDVGKPPTFRRAPDRIRFDGHVEIGVAMGAEICRRFRFSNDETRQILALIENHMRFADAPRMKASTLKRFFRLECFDEHLALHRMDVMAAHGNLDIWNFVRERRAEMPEETVRPQPLLTGRNLIAAGYTPGPRFKEMLAAIEDAQLEGAIATPEEAMALVRSRFGG